MSTGNHHMLIDTSAYAVTLPAARLVIHAEARRCGSDSHLANALQWLRALYSDDSKVECEPLRLQIADLRGSVMLASDDSDALVDVSLPAGTYQVTAWLGKVRRDYTLALEQGTSFDLYLRLAPEKQ